MCLPRGGIQFLSVGVMDFPVGARILHPVISFVTASIPPFAAAHTGLHTVLQIAG
jgi:hypothetical protein